MDEFLEQIMLEAIRRDAYAQANQGIKKPFEVLVAVKRTSENGGELFTSQICLN